MVKEDKAQIKARLEYLREQIEEECISYGEIAELESLADEIEPGDILLLEWAGVSEKSNFNGGVGEREAYANGKYKDFEE